MIIGIPRELKKDEHRVALLPAGAEALHRAGHTVLIESNAGKGSGIADDRYAAAGATIVPDPAEIWGRAELIVKVK
jgi:alanine dehydrogenase